MVSSTVNVCPSFPFVGPSANPSLQVVRYSALFSGIAYGWYHRRTLQAAHDNHKREEAVHQREKLIAEAKDAWKRKQEASSDTNRTYHVLYSCPAPCLGLPLVVYLVNNTDTHP